MRQIKRVAASLYLFASCVGLAACGGGGGESRDDEDLQPYATLMGYGPLILHIVNETPVAVTNVNVLFSLPDTAYYGAGPVIVDCPSATFLPAAGFPSSQNDYVLTVPSMTPGEDCSVKVPVNATGTVRVAKGGATADGGLSNLQAYEFTYRAP